MPHVTKEMCDAFVEELVEVTTGGCLSDDEEKVVTSFSRNQLSFCKTTTIMRGFSMRQTHSFFRLQDVQETRSEVCRTPPPPLRMRGLV